LSTTPDANPGLYAAGDVQNPFSGALEAAYTGGMSAVSIVHEWYD
jgi:hypothetical protein